MVKFITSEDGKVLLHCQAKDPLSVTEITVPEGIMGIDGDAFEGFDRVKRIVLPQSAVWFERTAFHGKSELEELIMPSMEALGPYPFSGCTALREFVVPQTLKYMGYAAFGGAKNLKRLIFSSIDKLKRADFGAFVGVPQGIEIVYPTKTNKPIIAYKEAFGTYQIDRALAKELRKKPLIAQAQEFELRNHSSPEFQPSLHLMGSVNGFFDDYKSIEALIVDDGLFVGYLLRVCCEEHKQGKKTVLIGQTVWRGWERHMDTSGDNNGAGYKGGEDYYTKVYATLTHA